ncbi:DUF502 domain-containing protein [Chloroflexota bacterium]
MKQLKWLQHTRNAFLAGIIAAIPLVVTYLVLRWLFLTLDDIFQPVIIFLIDRTLPGVGIVAIIVLIYLLGLVTTNIVGHRILNWINSIMSRAPIIRYIYEPATQVVNALRSLKQIPFKKVVIVEFPRTGMYSLAFVTGLPVDIKGQKKVPLFVPNVPNPLSGFLLMISAEDIVDTNLTIDEAMRMLLSAGLLSKENIS